MRNVVLLFMILFSTFLFSQDYLPILSDGKTWNCAYMSWFSPEGLDVYYTATVGEDTIYDNQIWRKVYFKADKEGYDDCYMLHEEDGKLYVHFGDDKENKKILLIDFNLKKGEEAEILPLYSNLKKGYKTQTFKRTIQDVDTINVDGILHKRITININSDGKRDCWVEGIGSNCTTWMTDFPKPTSSGYWVLGSCFYDGHEFTLDDFQAKPVTGIKNVTIDKSKEDVMYDLFGRKITTPQKNKIVISNGRKIFVGK